MQRLLITLGFWDYNEIRGQGMKSDQILQEYDKLLNENISEGSLNKGLLNSPGKKYKGLNSYPYSGSSVWLDNEWKLHQIGETFELYNLETIQKKKITWLINFPSV